MTAPKPAKTTARKTRPVLVTTEHKGVFFGHTAETDPAATTIELTEAQMCVYWSADVRGVLGLAATGPSNSCKVTPIVPNIVLQAVTAVIDCTDAAEVAWRARPWR